MEELCIVASAKAHRKLTYERHLPMNGILLSESECKSTEGIYFCIWIKKIFITH